MIPQHSLPGPPSRSTGWIAPASPGAHKQTLNREVYARFCGRLEVKFLRPTRRLGTPNWDDIALYGRNKLGWLRSFLTLANGIPSHDTFRRVFMLRVCSQTGRASQC